MKVVVVMAAFNEGAKIGKVLAEVARYVDKIVVVDDGSTDATPRVAQSFQFLPQGGTPHSAVAVSNFQLLRHAVNLGQGAALQTGFEYAKKIGADVVITFDADGQFEASDIPKLVKPIEEGKADVVLGSRFLGRAVDIPFMRLLVLRLGMLFTYIFSNIKLSDTHNGFRAFSKKAIAKMDIRHNRWAHPSDVIYQISKNRFRVVEVPVTISYTKYSIGKGQSNLEALRIPFELILRALVSR